MNTNAKLEKFLHNDHILLYRKRNRDMMNTALKYFEYHILACAKANKSFLMFNRFQCTP